MEGYYKNFRQLTNLNRFKIYEDNALNADEPDRLKKDFIIEKGYAAGLNVTVILYLRAFVRIGGILTHLHAALRRNRDLFPSFDRRHNLNLLATVKLGKKKSIKPGKNETKTRRHLLQLGAERPF